MSTCLLVTYLPRPNYCRQVKTEKSFEVQSNNTKNINNDQNTVPTRNVKPDSKTALMQIPARQ